MPSSPRRRSALALLLTLVSFFALASAQSSSSSSSQPSCYYPDGTLSTTDTPCQKLSAGGGASACCRASAFCMSNGLCFAGGILSRGSCTDKTWGSQACAGYCRSVSEDASISITPCSSSTFACGLDSASCAQTNGTFALPVDLSVVLRPAQVAQLLGTAVTQAPANNASTAGTVPVAAVAGVAVGMAIPLLLAIACAVFFWRKSTRPERPQTLYPLPDPAKNQSEFSFRPPPTIAGTRRPSMTSNFSETTSFRTGVTTPGGGPPRTPTHAVFGNVAGSPVRPPLPPPPVMVELDSKSIVRHELGDGAVSSASVARGHGLVREVNMR